MEQSGTAGRTTCRRRILREAAAMELFMNAGLGDERRDPTVGVRLNAGSRLRINLEAGEDELRLDFNFRF